MRDEYDFSSGVRGKYAERVAEDEPTHFRFGGWIHPHCGGVADDDVGKPGYKVTDTFLDVTCEPCKEAALACEACRLDGRLGLGVEDGR